MPRVRVHQHVNPLAPFYRFTPNPLVIGDVFPHPERPLLLDLGCARGRFLLQMAELERERNFVGVEIREPLVDEANRLAAEAKLDNLHYEFCNAMIALDKLLAKLPDGILDTVTIQFPDPWFKKKHAKRRMVNDELAETVVRHLAPKGRLFVQTDIKFLADEMFAIFRNRKEMDESAIAENPFAVKTEREKAVEDKDLPVYRTLFTRR